MSDETMLAELRERLRPLRESYGSALQALQKADGPVLTAVHFGWWHDATHFAGVCATAHDAFMRWDKTRVAIESVMNEYPDSVTAHITYGEFR